MSLLRFLPKSFDPIRIIEWVVALATAFSGLYIYSPFYDPTIQRDGPGAIAAALHHPDLIYIYGGFLLLGTLALILGLVLKKTVLRSTGLFTIFAVRFFQVTLTLITMGFQPVTWIFPFTIMCIVLVLWITERLEVINNGRS